VSWVVDEQGRREDVFLPRTNELAASSVQVAGADGAAVAIVTGNARARDLLCATDAVAARMDELQFTIGHGPCLEAFLHQQPVMVSDLGEPAAVVRWPVFASEVLGELDVHGVFAFPIVAAGGARLGVLELYRYAAGSLSEDHCEAAAALAEQLGSAVLDELGRYRGSPSERGIAVPRGRHVWARTDISTALGMTAVRLGVPTEDASAWLRAQAYARSRSISSLAGDIVERRSFPD
jgi:hypothetical protein